MSRAVALIVGIVALCGIGCVTAVLIIDFRGNDSGILIAAIFGFLTPTIVGLLTLLQSATNAEKVIQTQQQVSQTQKQVSETQQVVAAVNEKVNGHLARLTQIVVNSAAASQPVTVENAAALAARTEQLTGETIITPKVQ